MEKSGAKAYLVNTGWNGTGKRISIRDTRGIIDAILDGSIAKAPTKQLPFFNFEIPTELPGVDPKILDPRDTYAEVSQWRKRQKIWHSVLSRTLQNMRATRLERHWFPLVLSYNHKNHLSAPRQKDSMIEGEPDVRFSFSYSPGAQ